MPRFNPAKALSPSRIHRHPSGYPRGNATLQIFLLGTAFTFTFTILHYRICLCPLQLISAPFMDLQHTQYSTGFCSSTYEVLGSQAPLLLIILGSAARFDSVLLKIRIRKFHKKNQPRLALSPEEVLLTWTFRAIITEIGSDCWSCWSALQDAPCG